MPSNIFVSVLGGICIYKIRDDENTLGESDSGVEIYGAIGKEWWTWNNWALGVRVFFYTGSATDKGEDGASISDTIFGVFFSATRD